MTDVHLPSGAVFHAVSDSEEAFVEQRTREYLEQFAFTNVSDLAELDRVVAFEALVDRYTRQLSSGIDEHGSPIDLSTLRGDIKNLSLELRQVKKTLGIDKVARERSRGEGSVHAYLTNLLRRAQAFDIHRDDQRDAAIELMNEAIGLVTFHRNCLPEEREQFRVTADDIIEWFWTVAKAEYEKIDHDFIDSEQSTWVDDCP